MLRAEIGVVASLKKCTESWCKLKVNDTIAWAKKENLWGVYPSEFVK
jgi:SH3-like domain-containing protein